MLIIDTHLADGTLSWHRDEVVRKLHEARLLQGSSRVTVCYDSQHGAVVLREGQLENPHDRNIVHDWFAGAILGTMHHLMHGAAYVSVCIEAGLMTPYATIVARGRDGKLSEVRLHGVAGVTGGQVPSRDWTTVYPWLQGWKLPR